MLSVEECQRIFPYLPSLFHYMRSFNPHNMGKVFLDNISSDESYKNELRRGLREFSEFILNTKYNPTNGQLKNSFYNKYSVEFWGHCILYLFAIPYVRLIPTPVSTEVLNAFKALKRNSKMRSKEIAKLLQPILDKMPWISFSVLGELCSMLSCTVKFSKKPKELRQQLSEKLGPILFSVNPTAAPASSVDKKKSLQTAVMRTLIKESNFFFDDPVGKPKPYAMGSRSTDSYISSKSAMKHEISTSVSTSSVLSRPPRDLNQQEFQVLKLDLVNFYKWRDPDYIPIVDDLFDSHEFYEIAHGILHKYGMLPKGWMIALQKMRAMGVKLDWFDSKTVVYVDRPLIVFPPTNYAPNLPKDGRERTETDIIVDEILDTELNYFQALNALMTKYVAQVESYVLSASQSSVKELKSFGLTINEVEEVFGSRLKAIISLSREILVAMEPINLVRKTTLYVSREARIGDVFAVLAPRLHCYAPYLSAHTSSVRILNKAQEHLEEQQKIAIIAEWSGEPPPTAKNFITLWQEISASDPSLAGQSIPSILIKPVQQVPRYKLLLERLIHNLEKNNPVKPMLEDSLALITQAAKEINKAVRQHLKVESILGEEITTPKMAKAKPNEGGKNGFFQILNLYPQ